MTPRIRILHFAHVINRYDFADTVLSRLDRDRFETAAVAGLAPTRTGAYSESEQYPCQLLGYRFHRRAYPRMLRDLLKAMRRFRPHILHAHHFDENLVAALAFRVSPVPAYVLGRHYSDQIYLWASGWKRRVFLAAENFSNRTATRIVVQNEEVARILVERQGISREKIEVLIHGLDFDRLKVSDPDSPRRIRLSLGWEGKFMLLFCGRLIWIKSVGTLLEALRVLKTNHADIRLAIVGTGPQEEELKRLASDLGLDEIVHFAGWRSDAIDWMAAADLLVSPSLTESFPQVLIESLSVGTPAIMTSVGSAPEIIGGNERGRIVPREDSGAIVSAVEELKADESGRMRLADDGRRFVLARYRAEDMIGRYENLYDRISREAGVR